MKVFLGLLMLPVSLPSLAVVNTGTVATVERERGGGFAQMQQNGLMQLNLRLEDIVVDFTIAKQSEKEIGLIQISFEGDPAYETFGSLYHKYVEMEKEPRQVLTFMDRQVIYAYGVACTRRFSQWSYDDLRNGDFTPNIKDSFLCTFVMNSRNGFTASYFMQEPRPRMGMGN